MKCQNQECKNLITQPKGKRVKKYCSDNCRASSNQRKKAKRICIPIEEWNLIQAKLKELTVENKLADAANKQKPIIEAKKVAKSSIKENSQVVVPKIEKEGLNEPKKSDAKEMPSGLSRTEIMKWQKNNL